MSEIQPSPLAPDISPLAETDPLAINELIQSRIDDIFNKKPKLITDDDLRIACAYYRKERQKFQTASLVKESKPPTQRRKKEPIKSVVQALTLLPEDDE
jgi:hypothetical protein